MKQLALLSLLLTLTGCMSVMQSDRVNPVAIVDTLEAVDVDRILIWRAYLSLEVSVVADAVAEATRITTEADGYVESQSDSSETHSSLTLRVPADALKPSLASLETLGTVSNRSLSSEDVTEQYIDVDARLKTKIALRDRLRELLQQASEVRDILALEKELSRVQADIDSMQARLKTLKGQADLATINISLNRRPILGPLGYLGKGAWWALERLFIIRE